jgi:hypothetical protein
VKRIFRKHGYPLDKQENAIVLTGLTTGTTYTVRARAIGGSTGSAIGATHSRTS